MIIIIVKVEVSAKMIKVVDSEERNSSQKRFIEQCNASIL